MWMFASALFSDYWTARKSQYTRGGPNFSSHEYYLFLCIRKLCGKINDDDDDRFRLDYFLDVYYRSEQYGKLKRKKTENSPK